MKKIPLVAVIIAAVALLLIAGGVMLGNMSIDASDSTRSIGHFSDEALQAAEDHACGSDTIELPGEAEWCE